MPLRLIDRYGRVPRDLRISVTTRCSLRCRYCVPSGSPTIGTSEGVLTRDELVRLVSLLVDLGIDRVRLTGGEPLLRADIVEIVTALRGLPRPPRLALTSNGLRLPRLAAALAAAGLDRVNISLDTLRRDRFRTLTGADRLDDVLAGVRAAKAAGLDPVKINTVLLRGINDDEILDLARWAIGSSVRLRFIERMPFGPTEPAWADKPGAARELVPAGEILDRLSTVFRLEPLPGRGPAPCQEWLLDGGPATVGIIAAVTRPFCGDCDRLRLTADGQLRSCLFSHVETDLRQPIRAGFDDRMLRDLVQAAVWAKVAGHRIGAEDFTPPTRPMWAIGG